MDRFLWAAVLLLPLWSVSGAVPPEWLPGAYDQNATEAARFADDYSNTAEKVLFMSVTASWNYNTNLTANNAQLQVRALTHTHAHAKTSFISWTVIVGGGQGVRRPVHLFQTN